jgi:hypothetical protein
MREILPRSSAKGKPSFDDAERTGKPMLPEVVAESHLARAKSPASRGPDDIYALLGKFIAHEADLLAFDASPTSIAVLLERQAL